MDAPDPSATPRRVLATLRDAAGIGLVVGGIAGLADAALVAAGVDSSLALIRLRALDDWREALFGSPKPWGTPLGLLGCLAASSLLHALAMASGGIVVGLALHPGLREVERRLARRRLAALAWGAWLFLELYWWTRSLVLPGLSAVDPRRLAAAAGIAALGLVLGYGVARAAERAPAGGRRALRASLGLAFAGGALFLVVESGRSSDLGRINERNRDLPNVLIVVVDALRQDVIGAYGSEKVATPRMDELARRGVLFEEAFVQAPFTWTSFGSFLTGKYPRRHGLVNMEPGFSLGPNITFPFWLKGARRTDGQQLAESDFAGAAFMTGTLSHGSGLLRGFDYYFEALVGHELVDVHSQWSRFRSRLLPWQLKNKLGQRFDSGLVVTTAVDWLRRNADRRFVSMVHLYSTHTPYDPPQAYRSMYVDPAYAGPFSAFYAEHRHRIEDGVYEPTHADRQQIANLYYAGVTQADAMIGRVLDELERLDILEDTIVVVTSDHGEELGEHDVWEHDWMFQTNLRIPWILAWPKGLPQGVRVAARVDSIDLLPTLCDLMGLELPVDEHAPPERALIDGVSLLPLVRGEAQEVRPYSFAENSPYRSIQDGRFKLIAAPECLVEDGFERILAGELPAPRFFDLANDPGEHRDLFAARPEEAREYWRALMEWSASMPIGDYMIVDSHRDIERELLHRALGYAGGGDEEEEDAHDPPGGSR